MVGLHVHNEWDVKATETNRQISKDEVKEAKGKKARSEKGSSIKAHTFQNLLWKNQGSFVKGLMMERLTEDCIGCVVRVEKKNCTEGYIFYSWRVQDHQYSLYTSSEISFHF